MLEAPGFEPALQGFAIDAEHPARFGLAAADGLQDPKNVAAFHLVQ